MSTRRQVTTNRSNAKLSSGPKTSQGKDRSSRNSLKHGLLARDAVLPYENRSEFDQLAERLMQQFRPISELESELVRKITGFFWRLRRCGRIETEILAYLYNEISLDRAQPLANLKFFDALMKAPALEQVSECPGALKGDVGTLGEAFIQDSREANALPKLSRYEKSIEQSLYKALHELERLQAVRSGKDVPVPFVLEVNREQS